MLFLMSEVPLWQVGRVAGAVGPAEQLWGSVSLSLCLSVSLSLLNTYKHTHTHTRPHRGASTSAPLSLSFCLSVSVSLCLAGKDRAQWSAPAPCTLNPAPRTLQVGGVAGAVGPAEQVQTSTLNL